MPDSRIVGIAQDQKWYERCAYYADKLGLKFEVFDIARSDWIDRVHRYCCIVWHPNLDHPWREQAYEKIWFMEKELGLRVFPNWRTFSTYDNKKAQAYFFQQHGIRTPKTFVSYSRQECEEYLSSCSFPIVSKTSGGAASCGVRLLSAVSQARSEIRKVFRRSITSRILERLGYRAPRRMNRPDQYVYWQEFVPDNDRDCRVTVIGQRYVYVLYRRNRSGDFRASGGGLLEYDGPVGDKEVCYLADLCKTNNYDFMAFDLLLQDGEFCITEMSYMYPLKFLDEVPGHYVVDEDGRCAYQEGKVVSQELQMRRVAEWVRSTYESWETNTL